MIADELFQAVNGLWGGVDSVFKAEPPCVNQRSNGNIERPVGFDGYFVGQLEYVYEHLVGLYLLVAVDFGDDRPFIKGRHRLVYLVECGHNFLVQVLVALVNDTIRCTEDCTLVVLIRCILLLLDDVDCSNNEEQKKGYLPKQASFSIWSGHLLICLVLIVDGLKRPKGKTFLALLYLKVDKYVYKLMMMLNVPPSRELPVFPKPGTYQTFPDSPSL